MFSFNYVIYILPQQIFMLIPSLMIEIYKLSHKLLSINFQTQLKYFMQILFKKKKKGFKNISSYIFKLNPLDYVLYRTFKV